MKKRDILYLLAFMFIVYIALGTIFKLPDERASPLSEHDMPSDADSPDDFYYFIEKENEITPEWLKINARSACVMDFETGSVLYEKNAYRKRPMASTTKIMTAIVALDSSTLDDVVTISAKAANMGGSVMGLREGASVRMEDLLHGLLICSGNDAAVAIAEHCGGSVYEFCEMMNRKALEIGAYETSFSNPHGLDAENHYTTAYDLAKITRYALKNPIINRIVEKSEFQFEGRTLRSTNEMLLGYEGADGVKTGYTGLAGRCLVTSATRNNMRLISVVLFCDSKSLRTSSSKKILDYCFSRYNHVRLLDRGSIMGEVAVDRAKNLKKIRAGVSDSVLAVLGADKNDMLATRVSLPEKIQAPILKGSILGTVSVFQGDRIIAESSLIAMDNAERMTFEDYMSQVIAKWVRIMQ